MDRERPSEGGPGFENANYNNPTVERIAQRLGEFDYGEAPEDNIEREWRPEVIMENGAIYDGEWSLHTN